MDVLHHDLKAVEASRFGDLHFSGKPLDKVLINDAVRGGEEGQHMRDEVALIVVQPVIPVVQVFGQVDFLGGPERGLGFFVHLPDLHEGVC